MKRVPFPDSSCKYPLLQPTKPHPLSLQKGSHLWSPLSELPGSLSSLLLSLGNPLGAVELFFLPSLWFVFFFLSKPLLPYTPFLVLVPHFFFPDANPVGRAEKKDCKQCGLLQQSQPYRGHSCPGSWVTWGQDGAASEEHSGALSPSHLTPPQIPLLH